MSKCQNVKNEAFKKKNWNEMCTFVSIKLQQYEREETEYA